MNVDLLDGLVRPEQVLEGEDAMHRHAGHPVEGRVSVDAQSAAFLHCNDAFDGVNLKFNQTSINEASTSKYSESQLM